MVEQSNKANTKKVEEILNNLGTIDPNVLVKRYFQFKADGKLTDFTPGRGVKEFTGVLTFKFFSITDPTKTLLSQGDITANFCLGHVKYKYGKDKEPIILICYGPPSRVLDLILAETDKYYHEDIITWQAAEKLDYYEKTIKPKNKQEAHQKLKLGMKTLFEGFYQQRKAAGKKEPQFFTEQNIKLLDQIKDWEKSRAKEEKKIDLDNRINEMLKKNHYESNLSIDHLKPKENFNPFAFKSAATKDVINEGIYKYLTPAEILTQRLAQTGVSAPQLASALKFDISTVYHHLRGTRDVDRKAALRYASFFNCDPADILFPPIKINLTGTVDIIKDGGVVKINYDKKEQVLCPRDFYSNAKDIKSIKINSVNSVYHDHVAYYYYTNKKETDCENKICFIGVKENFEGSEFTSYFIGIYENYRGQTKILNADPYRNKEVILENPNIEFITPIIGIVNIDKVKFSPIVDVKLKMINEDEKLKSLEKKLELAENHWWIENQKLSGKNHTSRHKAKSLDKMYADLRELRLQVDQHRRAIAAKAFEQKHSDMDKRLEKYMEELKNNLDEFRNEQKRA